MSEDKPLPCGFCGDEAAYYCSVPSTETAIVRFDNHASTCPFSIINGCLVGWEHWDNLNCAAMAQRRKDYEAGIDAVYDVLEYGKTIKLEFDDYIKEQNER